MANSPQLDWVACRADDDCGGIWLDGADDRVCVFHTEDEEARERWWESVRAGEPIDARGLTFTAERLEQLLEALPRDDQDRPRLTEPNFTQARFEGNARFSAATFTGNAEFGGATFTGNAQFGGSRFTEHAWFRWARFTEDAWFRWARFTGNAWFDGATFTGNAQFDGSRFRGDAQFRRVIFDRAISFGQDPHERGTIFEGRTLFDGTTFRSCPSFAGAEFQDDASFRRAMFHDGAVFKGAFEGRVSFGGASFAGRLLDLSDSGFTSRLDLKVSVDHLDFRGSRVDGGGRVQMERTVVDLKNTHVSQPFVLDGDDEVRLISLQDATVTALILGPVDLRSCRFAGAHDLDQLRVPHTAQLERPPSRLLASRRVLAEEILWRQHCWKRRHWPINRTWQRLTQSFKGAEPRDGNDSGGPPPSEIAEIYRALRTGRETRGDEPGAADFYYGEMEMRRNSSATPIWERVILWSYWLLSGYALRASRALIALAIVLAGSTWFLSAYGFEAPTPQQAVTVQVAGEPVEIRVGGSADSEAPSSLQQRRWEDAFWASLESVVLRAPQNADELTDNGRHFTTVLRFIGPILLALAALSVRGRVKR